MFEIIVRLFRWILDLLGVRQAMSSAKTATIRKRISSTSYYEMYTPPPYRLRDDFLSPAEFTVFRILNNVVQGKAQICVKVNLSDLFWVQSSDNSEWRTYTNKIDRKHLDYLLCHPTTMKPLLGIELDDSSHQRADRAERDVFVDEVFEAAGLPLIHIPVRRGYHFDELASLIMPHLEEAFVSTMLPKVTQPELAQDSKCPKCGGEMVLRTAKKGKNAGQQFWGCANYPQCRTILAFEENE